MVGGRLDVSSGLVGTRAQPIGITPREVFFLAEAWNHGLWLPLEPSLLPSGACRLLRPPLAGEAGEKESRRQDLPPPTRLQTPSHWERGGWGSAGSEAQIGEIC